MALIPIKTNSWTIISDNISMNDSSKLNNGGDGYMFMATENPTILKGGVAGKYQLYIDTSDKTLHLEEINTNNLITSNTNSTTSNCYKIPLNNLPFFVVVGDPTSCNGKFRGDIFPASMDKIVTEVNFQCLPHCIGANRQCFLRTDKTRETNMVLYNSFVAPDFDFGGLVSQATKTDCINATGNKYWKCDTTSKTCSSTSDTTPYTDEGDCNNNCGKPTYWKCIKNSSGVSSCNSTNDVTPYKDKPSCDKVCKKGGSSNLLVDVLIGVAVLIVIVIIALIVYMYMLGKKGRITQNYRYRSRGRKGRGRR